MTVLLNIHRLHKQFGTRLLLDIDNLAIQAATAYVLTGANGAGHVVAHSVRAGIGTTSENLFSGTAGALFSIFTGNA